ncbi:glycerate kinase type-2 family protein [Desulfosudis oleivorans]|uniref:Hydroxypyruvate reductase n=1 Tax=Desulfosudis oleivorans (strain DSM 6200 / JCM 39069 / Hxd3) TaxID=96561 RepID=A8ZZX7_DESOH|nr:glycerate kinase [Desulfosudis oleivorans]ABW67377.1 Hydroxypyruvate reductase [Desulfosudis oleivorans Hxd3]
MSPADTILDKMKAHAEEIFFAGLAAVEPKAAVAACCHLEKGKLKVADRTFDPGAFDHISVIGAGKAAAPMAAAVETLMGDRLTGGLLSVKYGHTHLLQKTELGEGGHPIPDAGGLKNAQRILALAQSASKKDLVICLLSGGGSALLPLPAPGITLADKQAAMHELLACGATITEINTLRKHLSAIKGGLLARAVFPATLLCLVISDVVGDDLSTIASGPTVADPTTFADCLRIIDTYQLKNRLPASVIHHIQKGAAGLKTETPKPGDPVFEKVVTHICADNTAALAAAADKARRLGYQTLILSSKMEGKTRDVARMHGTMAKEILKTGNPVCPPACLLSGGETTVTIRGAGKGGRNQEFCLALTDDIAEHKHIVVLSGGTDGTDGPTDAAGAVVSNRTASRAAQAGLTPAHYLADNDSFTFFKKLNSLLITGPTNTNVMDLRVVLVSRPKTG